MKKIGKLLTKEEVRTLRAEILPSDRPDRIVIFLPLKPNRRAGRKFLIAPDGATVPAAENGTRLTTMQRALGRAFYWRGEIESGRYEGIRDFACKNRLGEGYVYCQITLTLLAPSIVEGILAGTLPRHVTLQQLYGVAQRELWEEQEASLRESGRKTIRFERFSQRQNGATYEKAADNDYRLSLRMCKIPSEKPNQTEVSESV